MLVTLVSPVVALVAISMVAYCLITGLGLSTRRHWTDRTWRVTTAVACAYLASAFFFGDS